MNRLSLSEILIATLALAGSGPATACTAETTVAAAPTSLSDELSAEASALIERGRALLDARKPVEAETLFQQASTLEGESFPTQVWILRAWMDQGRSNDTLDYLDALRGSGRSGPIIDYLYGMAFARRAVGHIAAGVDDSSLQMNFEDAVKHLAIATAADPERFRDAFAPYARALWHSQELPRARAAIDRAIGFFPRDGETHLMKGRIALSQFQVAKGEEPLPPEQWTEETTDHWRAARHAFSAAMKCFGEPRDDDHRRFLLAQAAVQLGHTLVWNEEKDAAAKAYGTAMTWAPYAVDFASIRGVLVHGNANDPLAEFLAALEQGAEGYSANFGADDPGDSLLQWWLGYTRLELEDWKGAETALQIAVTKNPDYLDTWYRLALARYAQKNYEGAVAALERGWKLDPPTIVEVMQQGDLAVNLARIDFLISWSYEREQLRSAAFLAEIAAESALTEARYWNNLGFFLREVGNQLRAKNEEVDEKILRQINVSAWEAYSRALDLDPGDPQLLNDAAVILHHYLDLDLPKALAMYERAEALAKEKLDEEGITRERREALQSTLSDARLNQRELRELLEKRAKEEGEASPPSDDG